MDEIFESVFKSMNCLGVLITDGQGKIIQVEDRFEDVYGVKSAELLNRSVYDLESEGVFNPSAAAVVLKSKKEETIIQKINNSEEVIVTAFPIIDGQDEIQKVITFSRDMSSFNKLKNMYEALTKKIDYYSRTLDELNKGEDEEDFYTNNEDFKKILDMLERVAKYHINILLEGETGVGKSRIAKKIHGMSGNTKGKLVEINCGAIPEHLIESELFGYEKGAFTGADKKGKPGLFEVASGGTLFLDEISEMPLQAQVKLLKVLQSKEFRRIGGTCDIRTDCRILSATNKNLISEVDMGRFRRDLLYRLNAVSAVIPPLRERREDIITLSKGILKGVNKEYGLSKVFDVSLLATMTKYSWPGNVRELENLICKIAITSENDFLTKDMLPTNIIENVEMSVQTVMNATEKSAFNEIERINDLAKAMEAYEGRIVQKVFFEANSSIKLGKALNISQTTAARKIKKYIVGNDYKS